MHQFELRIHVGAPSLVKDDKRWQDIAHGIVSFRPVNRVTAPSSMTDLDRSTSEAETKNARSVPVKDSTKVLQDPTKILHQRPSRNSRISSGQNATGCNGVSIVCRKRTAEQCSNSETSQAKRTKRTASLCIGKKANSTMKNPISGLLKAGKNHEETPRPKNSLGTAVLVPVTTGPKLRISTSHMRRNRNPPQGSYFTDVLSNSCVEETLFANDASITDRITHTSPIESLDSSVLKDSFEKQCLPPNQEAANSEKQSDRPDIAADHVTFRLSQTLLDATDFLFGTERLTSGETKLGNKTQIDVDEFGQSLESSGRTETPSVLDHFPPDSSPLRQKSIPIPTPIIDLTISGGDDGELQVTRRDVLGPISSPLHVREETSDGEIMTSSYRSHLNTIRDLPRRIKCQAYNTNTNHQFQSFVPDYMLKIARHYKLVELFRPVEAPNSLRNSERGFWKMRIQIADLTTIAKSKRKSPTRSQWSEKRFMLRQEAQVDLMTTTPERDSVLRKLIYPAKTPGLAALWLPEQFKQFWTYLAKTIERGRAGYDSRATIDSCDDNKDGLHLEVRVWCYAECLTHIWLTLLGLSDGLISEMPMQWCVPGEGALITMSGQPKNTGSLGRWVEKKNGVDGFWGLEEVNLL